MSEKDFDFVMNVNLKGTFLVLQAFARSMVEYKVGGSFINLASIVGRTGNIGQSNYAPSKSGVETLTRVASKELAKYNIRVNAVVPGFIESPMTAKIPDKIKEIVIQQCALKRFGKPEGESGFDVFLIDVTLFCNKLYNFHFDNTFIIQFKLFIIFI